MDNAKAVSFFSPQEKKDLIISWLTLSLAFTIVIRLIFEMDFLTAIFTSLIAVGTGFVLHELAHRETAKSYGFHSEFRAWYPGLLIAVIIAFVSQGAFLFAAPGATYFFGENVTRKQNGVISIAGPATNIILGVLFVIAANLFQQSGLFLILRAASIINFSLALFNLIPVPPLDGSKVVAWQPFLWVVVIVLSGILVFAPEILFGAIGLRVMV